MKTFDLWIEGYAASGDHGTARFLGTYTAESFDAAVVRWDAEQNFDDKHGHLNYNSHGGYWTVWGCRIYDNEADARRVFG